MPRIKDLTGQKFNQITVIRDSGLRSGSRSVKWECVCDCGKTLLVDGYILIALRQKSCGCAIKTVTKTSIHGHTRHGDASKTYQCWANMKQRCLNPNHHKFKHYGARGITVCDEWSNSFVKFLEDMGEVPEGMTLERKDVNKGYSKENCCWATLKTQANNKTSNRILSFDGKSMTVSQWASHLNIRFATLRMRLHRNWSLEKALK